MCQCVGYVGTMSARAVSGPVTECQGGLSVPELVCQGNVRACQCQGSLSVS